MKINWPGKTIILLLFTMLFTGACKKEEKEQEEFPEYDGPVMSARDITTLFSDSAQVEIKLQAKKQEEFENGDREFPEGIFIEFFDDEGVVSTSIKAHTAFYYKEKNLYRAYGDVIVKSPATNEQLNTEELFWDPSKAEIYTDKFVRIESEGEILMGEGLEAKQDFSSYRILKPTGTIILEDEE